MGVRALRRAIFFDRDGVLNQAPLLDGVPHPPATLGELQLAPGAPEAVLAVRDAGFLAIVVTNQPDVASGTLRRETVDAINGALAARLELDGVYTCPHDDADRCACRKPAPGLVVAAAVEREIVLAQSYLIGDRAKDIACGRAAGCTTAFVDFGYPETTTRPPADIVASSLREAVERIMERETA